MSETPPASAEGSSPATAGTGSSGAQGASGTQTTAHNSTYNPGTYKDILNFEGDTPGLGVFSLPQEKPKKKVTVEVFRDTMYDKVASLTPECANIIQKTLRDLTIDPRATLSKKMPRDLTTEEEKSKNAVRRNDLLLKEHVKQGFDLEKNLSTLCSIILGQCTEGLKTQLKTDAEFNRKIEGGAFAWLLNKISEVSSGITSTTYAWESYDNAIANFIGTRQKDNEDVEHYVKRFEGARDRLCLAGGEHILSSPKFIDSANRSDPAVIKQQQEEYMSYLVIKGAHKKRSNYLARDLQNRMHLGIDEFPKTMAQARDILSVKQFSATSDSNGGRGGGRGGGSSGRGRGRGPGGRWTNGRGTGGRGTGNNNSNSGSEVHFMQIGTVLQQAIAKGDIIDTNWILLDTGSTSNGFCNKELISNIRKCNEDEKLKIIANGSGSLIFNKIGKSKLFENLDVHYNEKSVANILSFNLIANLPGVEGIVMNTSLENAIRVNFSDGSGIKFLSDDRGLYYYDTKHPLNHKINPSVNHYPMLLNTTVADNEKLFTKREIDAAKRAVQLQERLG